MNVSPVKDPTNMNTPADRLALHRRRFMTSAASGLGAAALLSLLQGDGVLADDASAGAGDGSTGALLPRPPHFPPTATNCIFIFLAGGTSQVELFDPKPKLLEMTGEKLPQSFFAKEKFFAIKPDRALIMGSRFGYRRYGQSGLEMSELLPHIGESADDIALIRSMHTDQFDHGPAEILFSTGGDTPGRPSAGAWVTYGLGSESQNLPGYVVLVTSRSPVSRSLAWGNGFLPNAHAGVLFQERGEPVLNLSNPGGITPVMQRSQLDAVRQLNRDHLEFTRDPEIQNRIASYELAFRMQSGAPELIDLRGETAHTHAAYGTEKTGEQGSFATNCLLARRLVERGVRFVSIFHRKWDHHSEVHKGVEDNCRIVDQPIGALLKDLKSRGMLDSTLVVWGTEFGRTPLTQNSQPGMRAGRDHHRLAFSVWLAGGGAKGGQVIGSTDELGWKPVDQPVHVHDFNATLLHLFGLNHLKLTFRSRGLDMRLTNQGGNVVKEVFS
jgi:Protein of unknown function (DUF1501)